MFLLYGNRNGIFYTVSIRLGPAAFRLPWLGRLEPCMVFLYKAVF